MVSTRAEMPISLGGRTNRHSYSQGYSRREASSGPQRAPGAGGLSREPRAVGASIAIDADTTADTSLDIYESIIVKPQVTGMI